MTVAEVIERLQKQPPRAEVCVARGGAYDTANSVEDFYPPTFMHPNGVVFISAEKVVD